MFSSSKKLLIILLLAMLISPAVAGLFGPPVAALKGRVNFIQPTNFTLLTDNNQVIRVMVAADRKVPAQVQVGVYVEITAVLGQDNFWYLDKFDRIQLQPNQ